MSSCAHVEAALEYARRDWSVFPVHGIVNGRCTCGRADCGSPGKHPLVRRGVHESTTAERQIRAWWGRCRQANVAIATGAASGIVAIDLDLGRRTNTSFGSPGENSQNPQDVWDSLGALIDRLPLSLVGLTGGGGLHLFYASDDVNLGNAVGSLPGIDGELPGVDLRANGGYVLAPPSTHHSGARYQWLDLEREPAPAPTWLKPTKRPDEPVPRISPAPFTGDGTAYGRAALKSALTSLRNAPVGQRNHTLNRGAFAMAQLVAGGELGEPAARAQLMSAALEIGLPERQATLTIASAFRAGSCSPRSAR